jgi:two-component system sensor histidine kinase KdpD
MEQRLDPDRLLARLQADEAGQRGRLKIFFGASAGVGKTYAMLEAAHEQRAAGDESNRLNRLVGNLLDMIRIEAGAVQVRKEWQPLEEVIGAALNRLEQQLGDRLLSTALPEDLPLVPLDGVLIEQVLVNLLENAIKYTPADSHIDITAVATPTIVTVAVADRGPGLAAGDQQRIFEKFYRAASASGQGGVGLGLTICRGIVEAHCGRIWAENRAGGGTTFTFTLPLAGAPPQVQGEEQVSKPVAG